MTETAKLRLVPRAASGLTWLVGGVVSISQEVESEPVPGFPYGSVMSAALMVSVYIALGSGQAGQAADQVGIRGRSGVDSDGARDQVGAAVIGQAQCLIVEALRSTISLRLTAIEETEVLRGFGETVGDPLTVNGGITWVVA